MSDPAGLANGVAKPPSAAKPLASAIGDFHDGLGRQVGNIYLVGSNYSEPGARKAGEANGVPNFGQQGKPAAGELASGQRRAWCTWGAAAADPSRCAVSP